MKYVTQHKYYKRIILDPLEKGGMMNKQGYKCGPAPKNRQVTMPTSAPDIFLHRNQASDGDENGYAQAS